MEQAKSDIPAKYERGAVVTGTITSVHEYGVFLELEPGVDSLCLIPYLLRVGDRSLPPQVYQVGETLTVRIYVVNRRERKIGVSERDVDLSEREFERKFEFAVRERSIEEDIRRSGVRNDMYYLERVIAIELDAEVDVEEVDSERFRFTVVSSRFSGMKHLARQDLLWEIVDRELSKERSDPITIILAHDPAELLTS
jgi:predicted RNA-binding protein with RPS1 domain/acid stress-induced BolA-like protein IbaG/YrbA